MKALTLWQPWASLVILGAKQFETRGWFTSYRGTLVITAAAKHPKEYFNELDPDMIDAAREALGVVDFGELPRGCALGTVELRDCLKVNQLGSLLISAQSGIRALRTLSRREMLFGDFSPGRFAWALENPEPFDSPVPVRGKQGLWDWEVTP